MASRSAMVSSAKAVVEAYRCAIIDSVIDTDRTFSAKDPKPSPATPDRHLLCLPGQDQAGVVEAEAVGEDEVVEDPEVVARTTRS